MTETISRSPSETRRLGADFARRILKRLPAVVGLTGGLGSGKTTFVQGMATGLRLEPRHYVNSPTFTLVNEYGNLIHVDLYRIEREEEIPDLGLEEYLLPERILVIEWAEKIPSSFLSLDFQVHFEAVSDRERRIRISEAGGATLLDNRTILV